MCKCVCVCKGFGDDILQVLIPLKTDFFFFPSRPLC